MVSIAPDAKTSVHHRSELERDLCRQGPGAHALGERLEYVAEARPDDFIFVPPYVPHQEIDADPGETLESVLVRSDSEAVVVNIGGVEPVEKPETIYWVDPIHRRPWLAGSRRATTASSLSPRALRASGALR